MPWIFWTDELFWKWKEASGCDRWTLSNLIAAV